MSLFRKILFWTHLITGCLAGVVILTMSVTGVLLTYERQMIDWSDRQFRVAPPGDAAHPLPAGALVTKVMAAGHPQPEGFTWQSDTGAPVALSYGRETLYANPYTGAILGKPTTGMRDFMSSIRAWHRWLAATGENRAVGKAITGASNVLFLFLVVSGLYLWLPRRWGWQYLKPILAFRRGLRGKARDFNWHNVAGFWTAIPLFFVVLSAMVISYPWFSQWVIELADGKSAPPAQRAPQGAPPPGQGRNAPAPAVPALALDAAFHKAYAESGWKTLSLRVPPKPGAPFTAMVSWGDGGQPQLRDTLTIAVTETPTQSAAANSGAVVAIVANRETFESLSLGRRIRSWMRFVHTGEYYGILGQTIAGIASAAGVLLVYSGFALAIRRFLVWRKRMAASAARLNARAA